MNQTNGDQVTIVASLSTLSDLKIRILSTLKGQQNFSFGRGEENERAIRLVTGF